MEALKQTLKCIPADIPVIADGKRGDIGNTSKAYARALSTISASMPPPSIPTLDSILSSHFCNMLIKEFLSSAGPPMRSCRFPVTAVCYQPGNRPLFEIVADKAKLWNTRGNVVWSWELPIPMNSN
jgi:orotidine-5'-phosphate decarboxylase